jgi:hypothetical protein
MSGPKNIIWLISGFLWLFSSHSWAVTLLELRNEQGQVQQVHISENYARMSITADKTNIYRLIDLQAGKMYLVNPSDKTYFDPDSMPKHREEMPNMPNMPEITAKLIKTDSAPEEIAGYSSLHYQVTANGIVCTDDYLSQSAAEVAHIAEFEAIMLQISKAKPKKPRHPCLQAHLDLAEEMRAIGLQMRSVYAGGNMLGKVRSEVISIKTDVEVAADFFSLQDLRQLSAQDMQRMQPRR